MEQPNIVIKGKKYWQVACENCQKANRMSFFFDEKKSFAVKCECGNTIELDNMKFQREPNKKAIPLRNII